MILVQFIFAIYSILCLTKEEEAKSELYLYNHLKEAMTDGLKTGKLLNVHGIPKYGSLKSANPEPERKF